MIAALVSGTAWNAVSARAEIVNPAPAWANPAATTLKRTGGLDGIQHEPNFLSNLDCDAVDFRLAGSEIMQTGCFTWSALGLIDSDNDLTIFNGTDEGIPLLPYSAHQVLVPWLQAGVLLTLDSTPTGGSYVGLYTSPLSVMRDQRDWSFRLTAKQMTAPPDLALDDPTGKPLVINPQTLAYSPSGSWLVAETLSGAFVRVNLASLEVLAFAPAYAMAGSPALLKSQVTISDDGNYVAIGNDAASELRVYDLANCGNGGTGWQDRRCASYDYRPFIKQRVGGLQSLRHLRFADEGLLSFEVTGGDPAISGNYLLAPADSIGPLIDYLALGDSYTSGEGAFDYLDGTDTVDNMCHLSVNSYPLLLTRALFSASSGHSVACSGAVINDVGNTSPDYHGQAGGVAVPESILAAFKPGFVAQHRFARRYQPAIMTVSVGGDDIGFGDIVRNCVEPRLSLRRSDNDCYNTYEDRLELIRLIDRTVPRWAALYEQLKGEAPGARLYVIGYPQIVTDGGDCALNVHLSRNELGLAEGLTDYLNRAVRQAADKAGATYVDVSRALDGHRLCEATSYNVAVNGLTAGKDGAVLGVRIFGKESYHPNALGQALMEEAILKQTHNLADRPVGADSAPAEFLNVPRTGRPANTLIPVKHMTKSVLRRGDNVKIKVSGPAHGLKPYDVYTVRLGGSAGQAIGSIAANANGDISADVVVPADTEAGGQTIDIIGQDQIGETVDLTQPVYVAAGDTDADGDGIPDNTDSCPGAVNSGQDRDHDGIDDACDGLIGLSLSSGSNPRADNSHPGTGFLGANRTGGPLNGVPLSRTATIVTAFATDRNHNGWTVNLFGTAKSRSPSDGLPKTPLLTINWFFWAKLLIIAWLLMLALGFGRTCAKRVRRLRAKSTKSRGFRLQ